MEHCIIIGASHAGAQLCVSLRQGGYEGDITLIGEEADMPYHRPPLSKDFLSGGKAIDEILLRPASVYDAANVQMKLGTRVGAIDRTAKTVLTDDGEVISYSKLVLATGARVRHLPVPGAELSGVYYLRDAADVRRIKAKVASGKRAVIIGGGYIGLETAASLRKLGLEIAFVKHQTQISMRWVM